MNNLRNVSNENGSVLTHVHICLIQKTLNTLCQPTTGLKWWTKQLWWQRWMSMCSDKLFWFSWCIQIPVVNYWPIISTTPGNKTELVFTVFSRQMRSRSIKCSALICSDRKCDAIHSFCWRLTLYKQFSAHNSALSKDIIFTKAVHISTIPYNTIFQVYNTCIAPSLTTPCLQHVINTSCII